MKLIDPSTTFQTKRLFPNTPEEVFSCFADPVRLAQWWGPKGFSNTFHLFEFKNNGNWEFVMHAPTGEEYANKCVFAEVKPNQRIVIKHVVQPIFTLTLDLIAEADNTLLVWTQEFESAQVAQSMRNIVTKANEENLDKLKLTLIQKQ